MHAELGGLVRELPLPLRVDVELLGLGDRAEATGVDRVVRRRPPRLEALGRRPVDDLQDAVAGQPGWDASEMRVFSKGAPSPRERGLAGFF